MNYPVRHVTPLDTAPPEFPPVWTAAYGQDGFGLWAELAVNSVTQRLRWIPPGEFLMGSSENEPKRRENEGPRHRVMLTEGFWLADTACTQALWQVVMGNNPSRFRNNSQNPVERVSWYEVRSFLAQLCRLTGVKAELPSEAQWEYACRAGTETPFWWGADLDTAKANYDGNFLYAQGKEGEYRQRTVPVKTFAYNPWGLWQMHGNVWEWCQDGKRSYQTTVVVNPEGPSGAKIRALRGGSWLSHGWPLRAAFRLGGRPGFRYDYVSFRFLLRSLQPEDRRAEP